MQKILIPLLLFLSLVPAYYANRWLQQRIAPRRSLGRLFLYMITALALVFVYTFLLVLFLYQLFGPPKG